MDVLQIGDKAIQASPLPRVSPSGHQDERPWFPAQLHRDAIGAIVLPVHRQLRHGFILKRIPQFLLKNFHTAPRM